MYCSTCGSFVPPGRRACGTCGASIARDRPLPAGPHARHALAENRPAAALRAHVCPRCTYQGEGIGYFSRGSRLAALIAVTIVTVGAMGVGGLIYYLVRREDLICPRCGYRWGRNGERALALAPRPASALEPPAAAARVPHEGVKRAWSILLFLFAACLMMAGIALGEVGMVAGALLAAGGGAVLLQAAGRDKERRREALLAALQLPVLKLAARQGGRLTVSEVAAHLGWPLRRAEKVLQSLDDGVRVDSEVTDDGVIVYDFRELSLAEPRHGPGLGGAA